MWARTKENKKGVSHSRTGARRPVWAFFNMDQAQSGTDAVRYAPDHNALPRCALTTVLQSTTRIYCTRLLLGTLQACRPLVSGLRLHQKDRSVRVVWPKSGFLWAKGIGEGRTA